MKKYGILLLAAIVVCGTASRAQASIEVVGSPEEGGSWYQRFHAVGTFGSFDEITAKITSAGTTWASPALSFSLLLCGITCLPACLRLGGRGDSVDDLDFKLHLSGGLANSIPFQFDLEMLHHGDLNEVFKIAWSGGGGGQWDIRKCAVPEPATMIVWSLLGLGVMFGMRVWGRSGSVGRQPWSPEARQAIHEIIARATAMSFRPVTGSTRPRKASIFGGFFFLNHLQGS